MRIYFMGICGTAMGNAALLLKELGHEVFGCDSGVYPPMSDVLHDAGIEVLESFDGDRLAELMPDKVVVGNSLSRGNPEVEWILEQSLIPYISLPALFHDMILPDRSPIVVAGTHGKTTTSTLTAYLLRETGLNPGWLIGGLPNDLPSGASLGKGKPFVIEGDEYDSAFFDKRSKFIHYRPQIAVLNNLEFDHVDIFRDLADVKRSFEHFLRIVPASGSILVNGDDVNIADLLPVAWSRVFRVGIGEENDLKIQNFKDAPTGSSFELIWKGKTWAQVSWPMHGLFNARNAAMASLASALATKCASPLEFRLSSLGTFHGVRRRQDVLYEDTYSVVLEDFAHHPTAVAAAIESLRASYPERRMTVCFEPRSNTSSSSHFQEEFSLAFSKADRVFFGAVHRAEHKLREDCLDTHLLASILNTKGVNSQAFDTNFALKTHLFYNLELEHKELFVFFSNGSFDGIPSELSNHLRSAHKCV